MSAASLVLAGCKTTSLPVPHVERIEQNRTTVQIHVTAKELKKRSNLVALLQRSRSNHWGSPDGAAILSTVAPLSYDHAERTPTVVIGGRPFPLERPVVE
jgi:hypothetical protein